MKKALIFAAVLSMATVALAQYPVTEFSHTWSDNLTYLSPRATVTDLMNYTDGNGVTGAKATSIASGYNVLDVNLYEGQNLYTGQCIDMTTGQFSLSLMYSDTDTADPNVAIPDVMGFWVRFYYGTYDPGDSEADPPVEPSWTYGGSMQNYFFEAPNDGNYHTFVRPYASADETFADPAMAGTVYKFRVDMVYWDAPLAPADFGVEHISFTSVPEPASMLILALGMLIRRR